MSSLSHIRSGIMKENVKRANEKLNNELKQYKSRKIQYVDEMPVELHTGRVMAGPGVTITSVMSKKELR